MKLRRLIIFFILFLISIAFYPSCNNFYISGNKLGKCYFIEDTAVYIKWYGGYTRAKLNKRLVEGADSKTFILIDESECDNCSGDVLFGKDKNNVFYRNLQIKDVDIETFCVLKNGYSKDKHNVRFKNIKIEEDVDMESFNAITNDKNKAYAYDKFSVFFETKRINNKIDPVSFKIFKRPYFKDKNNVYFKTDRYNYLILEEADSKTFTCPAIKSIINYQNYAFDKKRAYYFNKNKIIIIENIDSNSFEMLTSDYAKDKNRVFYQGKVIKEADAESFFIPHRINLHVGKDKNYIFVNGKIKK